MFIFTSYLVALLVLGYIILCAALTYYSSPNRRRKLWTGANPASVLFVILLLSSVFYLIWDIYSMGKISSPTLIVLSAFVVLVVFISYDMAVYENVKPTLNELSNSSKMDTLQAQNQTLEDELAEAQRKLRCLRLKNNSRLDTINALEQELKNVKDVHPSLHNQEGGKETGSKRLPMATRSRRDSLVNKK